MSVFTSPAIIRFRQADPGGIAFFGQAYSIAHDAYEDFVRHLGFEWKEWFANETWAVPIRQSSCEHLIPLFPSASCEVRVTLDSIGTSSFGAKYEIMVNGRVCSEVRLVHVFIDKQKRAKMDIPSTIRSRLESYQKQSLTS